MRHFRQNKQTALSLPKLPASVMGLPQEEFRRARLRARTAENSAGAAH
jgi:hypothetical protein